MRVTFETGSLDLDDSVTFVGRNLHERRAVIHTSSNL